MTDNSYLAREEKQSDLIGIVIRLTAVDKCMETAQGNRRESSNQKHAEKQQLGRREHGRKRFCEAARRSHNRESQTKKRSSNGRAGNLQLLDSLETRHLFAFAAIDVFRAAELREMKNRENTTAHEFQPNDRERVHFTKGERKSKTDANTSSTQRKQEGHSEKESKTQNFAYDSVIAVSELSTSD